MRIPGVKSIRQSARWVRSRFVNGGLILGYHRIAEAATDPFGLCVSPPHFAEHLAVLQRDTQPITLQELITGLQTQRLPKRAVVVTLDDGYLDTLEQAKPLLERFQIPATVFVVTGYLGDQFWWDQLVRIFCVAATLPHRWSIAADGNLIEAREEARAAQQLFQGAAKERRQLFALYQQLLPLPFAKQQKVMETLQCWAQENGIHSVRHTCRSLRPAEIVALNAGDLITIGAHTVTHPLLAPLPPATQRFEIMESKRALEALLGQPTHYFSYPNGSASLVTQDLVREAGFHGACASFHDVAWRGSDRVHLPRVWAPNVDGPTFSRWLARWLHE